jgi:putative spermidine/putrescine transport system substrate-binding protein
VRWPAVPSAAQEPRFDGVTLRVATFGGGWDRAVHELIGVEIEKRGGKVQYVLGPPRDNLAKLIASRGNPPFDVIEMDDKTFMDAMSGGLLEKIHLDKIPNRKELDPADFADYKVGAWVVQEGILYLPDKFKEAGVPPPTRYSDLDNPKLAGKVVFADLAAPGTIHILVSMAVDKGGNEANMQAAYDELKEDQRRALLEARGGRAAAARQRRRLGCDHAPGACGTIARQGHARRVRHAKSGDKVGILRPGWLGIVKGTKAQDAAEFFINAYIEAKAQEGLGIKRGVVPVNVKAREAIKNGTARMKETALLDQAQWKNMLRVNMEKLDPNYSDQVNRAVAK